MEKEASTSPWSHLLRFTNVVAAVIVVAAAIFAIVSTCKMVAMLPDLCPEVPTNSTPSPPPSPPVSNSSVRRLSEDNGPATNCTDANGTEINCAGTSSIDPDACVAAKKGLCDELRTMFNESVVGSIVIHLVLLAIGICLLVCEAGQCACVVPYVGVMASRTGRGMYLIMSGLILLGYSRSFIQSFEDEDFTIMALPVDASLAFYVIGIFAAAFGVLPFLVLLLSLCKLPVSLAPDALSLEFDAACSTDRQRKFGNNAAPKFGRRAANAPKFGAELTMSGIS